MDTDVAAPLPAIVDAPRRRSTHASLAYRPDIDGLRAVAVGAVVLYHAGLGVPGGFVGVDVFFVISGYLITALILKEIAAGTFGLANFWERRVRRIAPALLAMTLATATAAWFVLLPEERGPFGRSLVALVACVANVFFRSSTGYFEPTAEEVPLLHTWSLAVEEQFYVVVPFALLALVRVGWFRRVFVALAAAAGLSLLWSVRMTHRSPPSAFFLLPSRAWELLVGALLASAPFAPRGRWRTLAGWGGAIAIGAACFAYTSATPFPGLAAMPPVLGAAMFMWAGSGDAPRPAIHRLLSARPIVFVGLISYSLYLWHWPVFVFWRFFETSASSIGTRLGLVAASVALAIASWRFVERPFRTKTAFADRRRLFLAGGVAYACVAIVGFFGFAHGASRAMSPQTRQLLATSAADERFRRQVVLADVPDHLVRLGRSEAAPALLVWGDSHAMSILPAIDALCDRHDIAGRAATHSATAPTLDFYARTPFGLNEQAIAFNAAVARYVGERRIRVVILAGSWRSYVGRGAGDDLKNGLLRTVDALRARGAAVYFVTDVPVFDFDVRKMLLRRSLLGLDLAAVSQSAEQYAARTRFESSIVAQLQAHGAQVIDVTSTFADGGGAIRPFDAGGCLYSDAQHLSTYGAMTLAPLFEPAVARAAAP